jgi:hypothetical protein
MNGIYKRFFLPLVILQRKQKTQKIFRRIGIILIIYIKPKRPTHAHTKNNTLYQSITLIQAPSISGLRVDIGDIVSDERIPSVLDSGGSESDEPNGNV